MRVKGFAASGGEVMLCMSVCLYTDRLSTVSVCQTLKNKFGGSCVPSIVPPPEQLRSPWVPSTQTAAGTDDRGAVTPLTGRRGRGPVATGR